MAYAGDLKSPVLKRTCGFDSHPGHEFFAIVYSWLTALLARTACIPFDGNRRQRSAGSCSSAGAEPQSALPPLKPWFDRVARGQRQVGGRTYKTSSLDITWFGDKRK